MVMGQVRQVNVKTGEVKVFQKDFPAKPPLIPPVSVDTNDLKNLVTYAKGQGWI